MRPLTICCERMAALLRPLRRCWRVRIAPASATVRALSALAACSGQCGSNSSARPSTTRSARPLARISSAISGDEISPTAARRDAGLAADRLGEAEPGSRDEAGCAARGSLPPLVQSIRSTSPRALSMRQSATASVRSQPPVDPIGARQAHEQRKLGRPFAAHRRDRLHQQAGAVLERAAVAVGAPVAQRRQELMEQIAVTGMQLEMRKPASRARRAAAANASITSSMRFASISRGTGEPWLNGRGDGPITSQPPSSARQRLGALPRPRHRSLAAGVAELDRRHRALPRDEACDARERVALRRRSRDRGNAW